MTILEMLSIIFGGFLGAVGRYFMSQKMNRVAQIPCGTLFVNLLGSLLIGLVVGLNLSLAWTLFFASGFAGALTTFSTFKKEILMLWHEGRKKAVAVYTLSTYSGGFFLAWIGYMVGSTLYY